LLQTVKKHHHVDIRKEEGDSRRNAGEMLSLYIEIEPHIVTHSLMDCYKVSGRRHPMVGVESAPGPRKPCSAHW
jgi:hypothetical protein